MNPSNRSPCTAAISLALRPSRLHLTESAAPASRRQAGLPKNVVTTERLKASGIKPGQVNHDVRLHEDMPLLGRAVLTEETVGGVAVTVVKADVAICDIINRNGRYYPRSCYEAANAAAQPDMADGGLWGLMDHPDFWEPLRGSLDRIAIKWTEVSIEDDREIEWPVGSGTTRKVSMVVAVGQIVETVVGLNLKALLRAKLRVGISTNGYGSAHWVAAKELDPNYYDPEELIPVVEDDFRYLSLDCVSDPSNLGGRAQVEATQHLPMTDIQNDADFIEAMIPHHQAAIDMVGEYQGGLTNFTLMTLAGGIVTTQTAEILEMESIGSSLEGMGHMTMPKRKKKSKKEAVGDTDFINAMIPHHQAAIEMVSASRDVLVNEELIALAERISTTQGDEIARMQTLRRSLSSSQEGTMHSILKALCEKFGKTLEQVKKEHATDYLKALEQIEAQHRDAAAPPPSPAQPGTAGNTAPNAPPASVPVVTPQVVPVQEQAASPSRTLEDTVLRQQGEIARLNQQVQNAQRDKLVQDALNAARLPSVGSYGEGDTRVDMDARFREALIAGARAAASDEAATSLIAAEIEDRRQLTRHIKPEGPDPVVPGPFDYLNRESRGGVNVPAGQNSSVPGVAEPIDGMVDFASEFGLL